MQHKIPIKSLEDIALRLIKRDNETKKDYYNYHDTVKELEFEIKNSKNSKIDNLRNNVILYTTLKKYLDKKEKELAFLQKQYQDYQTKKNPQGNPNPIPIQPHQALRSLPKNDKNINQHKLPIARPLPSDIKEMELPLNSQNKNNLNRNNQNIQEINNIISNEVSNGNNIINQTNNDLKNNSTNVSVVNNTNEQQDNKQGGHKEKKKRITGTPKAKKRKNANEDDIIDEEKEQKSNSKKKKKGTK